MLTNRLTFKSKINLQTYFKWSPLHIFWHVILETCFEWGLFRVKFLSRGIFIFLWGGGGGQNQKSCFQKGVFHFIFVLAFWKKALNDYVGIVAHTGSAPKYPEKLLFLLF